MFEKIFERIIANFLLILNELRQRSNNRTFSGKIIPSNYDFQTVISDILGPHQVWYPDSQEDVATAIGLSRGFKTFVKSGRQVARQDVVDGTNSIVINLSELAQISVNENRVSVEAAATPEDVATQLIEHGLALPLSDDPLKSIVSTVLGDHVTHLTRSLGLLSDYVSELRVVEPDGTPVTLQSSEDSSCLAQWENSKGVITQITFEAAAATDLWMQRYAFPYPGALEFRDLVQDLFLRPNLPERCDLILDVCSGIHLLPIVRVTALGSQEEDRSALVEQISNVLNSRVEELPSDSFAGAEVLEAILDAGQGAGLDPVIDSERLDKIETSDGDREAFLAEYADYIHLGVAYSEDGTGPLERNLNLSARLQFNQDDAIEVTGYAYTPTGPTLEPTTPVSSFADRAPTTQKPIPCHEKFSMPCPTKAPSGPIPKFKGDVYERGDCGYRCRAKVYATTSYPEQEVTPLMIAYPRDVEDIKAAIKYVQSKNAQSTNDPSKKLSIVARSGGHQYSGKSSGGDTTIVLSMDAFNHLSISGNIAKVGPAVALTNLAARFKREKVTIPHGECPQVAIGGHAQTGGYGHLVRSFGLTLDHIEAFDIVLANGDLRTVTRPKPGSPLSTIDEELFWGVLGGNAGSFGIITSYTFDCIRDCKHKHSYGYVETRKYTKDCYFNLMKEVQAWTKRVEAGTLPDTDLMMTVISTGGIRFFPALFVEAVNKDLPVEDDGDIPDELQSIHQAISAETSLWENILRFESGEKDLSDLSDSFVRRWPATTHDGREFRYPYKKRVNCTNEALTDEFVEQFVNKVDEVVYADGVKIVFQMNIGGGEYQKEENRLITSIPHRDYVFCFVFDLFYREGYKSEAQRLQDEMQQLVDDHFSKDQEQRVFWGSFGDSNDTDISKVEVRQKYYDNEQDYKKLQKLKLRVDPNDIFHTSLTVKLPSQ